MPSNNEKIAKLKSLAELAFQNELSKLALICAKEELPLERLNELKKSLETHSSRSANDEYLLPIAQMGTTDNWARWTRIEIRKTAQELANIASEKEEQIIKAKRAFGKKSALEQIEAKLSKTRG